MTLLVQKQQIVAPWARHLDPTVSQNKKLGGSLCKNLLQEINVTVEDVAWAWASRKKRGLQLPPHRRDLGMFTLEALRPSPPTAFIPDLDMSSWLAL